MANSPSLNEDMKRVAIFDCCGTITKTNNTFHFINFVLKDKPIKKIIFKIIALLYILNMIKLTNEDLFRKYTINLLKGYSIVVLKEKANEYVKLLINKNLLNEKIIDLVQKERHQKGEIILLSASIDPPIEALAKELKIEKYFSSELEAIKNTYTGRLKKDLLKNKELIIEKDLKNIDFKNSSFYSDNLEDADVGSQFGNFVAIINSSYEEKRWKEQSKKSKITYFLRNKNVDSGYGYDASKEIGTVNKKNKNMVYFPTFYYFISRGVYSLNILTESILPYWFIAYFMTTLGLWESLKLTFLSHFLFYSLYEIGSLFNDLVAKKEDKNNATLRLANDIKINFALFLLPRIIIVVPLIIYLSRTGYKVQFFIGGLGLCLLIFFAHSVIRNNFRILTFIMLRVLSTLIPLLLLLGKLEILHVFTAFFINRSPKSIIDYISKKYNKKSFMTIPKYRFCYFILMMAIGILVYSFTDMIIYFIFPIYMCITNLIGVYVFKHIGKYEL